MKVIGKGLSCASKTEVTGEIVYIQTVEESPLNMLNIVITFVMIHITVKFGNKYQGRK